MKANVYQGKSGDKRKWVLVNGDDLLYCFDQPNWGFVGSGSTKVAEAIMVNEYGRGVEQATINSFLEEVVAKWPGRAEWTLTSAEIEEWAKEKVK